MSCDNGRNNDWVTDGSHPGDQWVWVYHEGKVGWVHGKCIAPGVPWKKFIVPCPPEPPCKPKQCDGPGTNTYAKAIERHAELKAIADRVEHFINSPGAYQSVPQGTFFRDLRVLAKAASLVNRVIAAGRASFSCRCKNSPSDCTVEFAFDELEDAHEFMNAMRDLGWLRQSDEDCA